MRVVNQESSIETIPYLDRYYQRGAINALQFSKPNDILLVGGNAGLIALDPETYEPLWKHDITSIVDITVDSDDMLYAASVYPVYEDEKDITLIGRVSDGALTQVTELKGDSIFALTFVGDWLAFNLHGANSLVWNYEQARMASKHYFDTSSLCGISGNVVQFTDHTVLTGGGCPHHIYEIDVESGQSELFGEASIQIIAMALSPNGKRLAIVDSQVLEIWDAQTRKPLNYIEYSSVANYSSWLALAWSDDSRFLATATYDGEIVICQVEDDITEVDRILHQTIDGNDTVLVTALEWGESGDILHIGDANGFVTRWSMSQDRVDEQFAFFPRP